MYSNSSIVNGWADLAHFFKLFVITRRIFFTKENLVRRLEIGKTADRTIKQVESIEKISIKYPFCGTMFLEFI